jgi:putative radical SAM enzyme (TIGR03279 family)
MLKVTGVQEGSIAQALGILPGTELLSINDRPLEDFLDWEFLSAEEDLVLRLRQPDGEEVECEIERSLTDPLGVSVEPPRIRRCANRCDFCFVDGLPQGLREVLYIRDDDYRLSFRYGNFATLTNLKPRDVHRIIEYRLSPLYVSVHATDPVLRRRLLRNPMAPDILDQLRHFARHGIRFHTQIVLQPGVNDGPALERSLADLYHLDDWVLSVSVVPVGLTEFSKHSLVREPTQAECRSAVETVERWQRVALTERGSHWAYGADELYLRAALELPPEESYEDFDQVENGVGSVRFLQRRIREAGEQFREWSGHRIGVVTGVSMGPLMPPVLNSLHLASGARFELIVVPNGLFGARVTTAGLLPGASIDSALALHPGLDWALLPGESLNDDSRFIDGMSADELSRRAPFPLHFSKDFRDALESAVPA